MALTGDGLRLKGVANGMLVVGDGIRLKGLMNWCKLFAKSALVVGRCCSVLTIANNLEKRQVRYIIPMMDAKVSSMLKLAIIIGAYVINSDENFNSAIC